MEEPGAGLIKIGKFEFSEEFWRKAFADRFRMTTVVRIDHQPSFYETRGSTADADGNVIETSGLEIQVGCHAMHFFGVFPAVIYVPLDADDLDERNKWQTLLQLGSVHDLMCDHFVINHGNCWSITFYEPELTPVHQEEYPDWMQYFAMKEDE